MKEARAYPHGAYQATAIVYARLGRLKDASTDLQEFLGWLGRQPEALRARYGSSRADWLAELKAGRNPFDKATLERVRRE